MKYAREVIGLMASFPGRPFRMKNLVEYVDPGATGRERLRIRVAIGRVLQMLRESGHIDVGPTRLSRGRFATYTWTRDES